MSWICRAKNYLIKNSANTLLLFLLFMFMGFLLTVATVISHEADIISDQLILNSGIYVCPRYELEEDITDDGLWSEEKRNKRDTYSFYRKTLERFFNDNHVVSYSYELYKIIYSETLHTDTKDWNYMVTDANYYSELIVNGVNSTEFSDLKDNRISIIEGTSFSQKQIDDGNYVCIVNENLFMDKNGQKTSIKVNDIIPLSVVYFDSDEGFFSTMKSKVLEEATVNVKVIGVFRINSNDYSQYDSEKWMEKTIIVPNKLVEELDTINQTQENSHSIEKNALYESHNTCCIGIKNVFIELDNADSLVGYCLDMSSELWDLNHSYNNIGNDGLPIKDYFRIIKSTELFEQFDWLVHGMKKYSSIIYGASFMSATLILCLILFLQIRKRRKEIGILLSMGESVHRIICQLSLESFLICLISLCLSISIGKLSSRQFSDCIVDKINKTSDNDYVMDYSELTDDITNNSVNVQSVTLSPADIVSVIGAEISSVLISTLVLSIYIRRQNPKQILIGGD